MSRRRRKEEVETDKKDKHGEGTKVATQPHVAPKGVLHPARRGVCAGRVPEKQGACDKPVTQKQYIFYKQKNACGKPHMQKT